MYAEEYVFRMYHLQRQIRRVYEILRLKHTNAADREQMKAYRLDIKRRLNIPLKVSIF